MKANVRKVKKYRKYSEEIKRRAVAEYESGDFSALELARIYKVSATALYKWIYKYSAYNERGIRVVEMKESASQKVKELEKRIAELERAVGQKQIKIDYLEKMMDIAKDELNIDIKKNYSTPQSTGSEKTSKK